MLYRILKYRTIPQLNTPFNYPNIEETTEVEIIDPTHPLFGRRFRLLSVSTPLHNSSTVTVSYNGYMSLRIPLLSTNIVIVRPMQRTKLTPESLNEFISTVGQWEGNICYMNQKESGEECPRNCKIKSSKNYRRF
jgi:hypothetical protein